jgi:hypothetical protein
MPDHDQAAAISSGDVEPIVQSSRNFRPSSFTRDGILSKLPNAIKGVRRPAGVQPVCRRSVPQAKFNHVDLPNAVIKLFDERTMATSLATSSGWQRRFMVDGKGGSCA